MKIALVLTLLLVTSPAHAWQPPSGGPSKMAKHVLDSLADPTKVAIPKNIEDESRSGRAPDQIVVAGGTDRMPPPPRPVKPGCWEVQLTAIVDGGPEAQSRANSLAVQESSRLGAPVHVSRENGLLKLRAGDDCLNYDDATGLRDRIRDSGYPGAFLIGSPPSGS